MKPTKAQLIALRESSYKPPPEERCETCMYCRAYVIGTMIGLCATTKVRGEYAMMEVHPAGKCDLYERKTDA